MTTLFMILETASINAKEVMIPFTAKIRVGKFSDGIATNVSV